MRRSRTAVVSAGAEDERTAKPVPPSPEVFIAAAAAGGFELDGDQLAAVASLVELASRTLNGDRPAPAIYLWGPVGRGKTWLIDTLVSALPPGLACRFHFYAFFRDFHQRLHHHGPGQASVGRALDDLVGGAQVVCFDELYAHEPGDAQLFTVILTELRERRDLPMVITSNYPPDGLMADAEFATSGTASDNIVKVRHASFESGIELIKRAFDVVSVDGGIDYRTVADSVFAVGFRSGSYVVYDGAPELNRGHVVRVGTRALRATVAGDEVAFDFNELCDQPVGASDVARLTGHFRSWRIDHVPRLFTCRPEAAQRFVHFVDVLCDADVRLVVTSPWTRRELVDGSPMPPDVARLESRLALLSPRGEHQHFSRSS